MMTTTAVENVAESVTDSFISGLGLRSKPAMRFHMVPLPGTSDVCLFEPGSQSLGFVNAEQRVYSEVSVPFLLKNVFVLDEDTWLLVDEKDRYGH
jgi:hypothetical protein